MPLTQFYFRVYIQRSVGSDHKSVLVNEVNVSPVAGLLSIFLLGYS